MKTLYKLGNDGSLLEWSIHGTLEISQIKIVYGQQGGLKQTQYVDVKTNNSGRNLKEQMLLEIRSRINKQRAKGYRDTVEMARILKGKNELNLYQPMLAQRYDKVNIPGLEKFYRQYKYDGHRMLVTYTDNGLKAYSRNGKPIETLGHILDGLHITPGTTIDGEVYCHGVPLQTIASWVKRKQPKTLELKYHVYDIVSTQPYSLRLQHLKSLLLGEHAEVVPTWVTDDPVTQDLADAIGLGYEGLILRNPESAYGVGKRSKDLIKVKEFSDGEFPVVDIHESADGWAIFECQAGNKTFRVSAHGTVENKRRVLNERTKWIGEYVKVQYFSLTKEGIPFHPVCLGSRNVLSE